MNDIVSYFVTLAGATAAALPSKVYDPIAWLAVGVALLIGIGIGLSRSPAWRLGWFMLFLAPLPVLASHTATLPNGDSGALVLLYCLGLLTGRLVPRLLGRSMQPS